MLLNKIYNKFLRNLGIKHADQSKLLWSALMVFIAGALQCYFSSFPIALFLTHYGSATLPKIYLAVAGLTVVFGVVYTFFEYRLSFNKLIIGLTMTIGIIWIFLGTALIGIGNNLIIVALLIWAILAFDLLGLAVWSVLNRIFSLQQAKNSFGLIKGCQSIGGVVAGLLSPLLLSLVGLRYLIVCLGVCSFLLIIVIAALLRNATASEPIQEMVTVVVDEPIEKIKMSTLLQDKYVLKIFSLIFLGIFSVYVIALLFNTASEAKYPSEATLAAFLGVFFGLVDGADLFCSIFLYNWLLRRFGLVATLFVLPVLGIILTLPILILNAMPSFFGIVFWLIVGLKLAEDSIRASLTHMSNLLLLQPFPPRVRSFLQSKSEVIVVGVATALISILLILMVSLIGVSIAFLTAFALLCFIITLFILWTLESDYIKALIKAIASRYFDGSNLPYPTKEDLLLLKNCLSSQYPDEVIYALTAIERIDSSELYPVLGLVMKSADLAVSGYALDKIKQYSLVSYFAEIIALLQQKNQGALKVKALVTAAHLDYEKSEKFIRLLVNDDFLPLSSAALIILFKHSEDSATKALAMEKLHEMIGSADKEKRAESAYIIGELADEKINNLLQKLTADSSKLVRRSAFEAVMKTREQSLYDELIKNLPFLGMGTNISDDFFKGNQVILSMIRKNFDSYSHEVKIKAIHIASQIKDKNAQEFIEEVILKKDDSLSLVALQALSHFPPSTEPYFLKKLFHEILREAKYLNEQYQYLLCTPDLELTALLRDVLKRKVQLSTERLLLALSLYYDKDIMVKARNGLEKATEDEKSYALELIDTTLETQHKKIISPLLSEIYLSDSAGGADLHSQAFHRVLQNNIKPPDLQNINLLTSMACAYVLIKGTFTLCSTELEELKQSNIQLIVDAIQWLQGEQEGLST
ncbi:MFS transporter [Legionella maioricensis]|uniref:MFS transporter n=1 Tax=Legionella maioricensis TaxID=2896528 RepID=A0A9X2I952_9GAMM|nr:MFS transporter [Legionella maioricensis]MCL9683149.1 MFS transporter [Legionella maioricensis]MCL9688048.1 MFS transporter [Legionella maioricensis]